MEIRRQGSNRKEGWSLVKNRKEKPVQVDLQSDLGDGPVVTFLMKRTKSHDGKGEYDHEVRLTIAEVAAIIEKLAGPGLAEFEGSVSEGLSGSVRSLHRLTAAASGIKVLP